METIVIPLFVALIGWFVTIRYKEVSKKRTQFEKEYSEFAESLLHFLNAIADKRANLN